MSDKELLELAAKAAGYIVDEYVSSGLWVYERNASWKEVKPPIFLWNPLKNDGNALRLAVKLNIECVFFDDMQAVNAGVWSEDSKPYDCMVPYGGDKQAATRRAIVSAATEIGRLTKE